LIAPRIYGVQLLAIDEKRRITIGSDFRRLIDPEMVGGAFVLTPGDSATCLYPEKYYLELMNAQVPPHVAPSRDVAEYVQLKFNLAVTAKLDTQWRITLPDSVIQDGNLSSGELALVGNQDHLRLYNRADWEQLRSYLLKNRGAIEARATIALQPKKEEDHL
jgi:DNA-binding transcriptional regulator/RsmH inhibitor MraZ